MRLLGSVLTHTYSDSPFSHRRKDVFQLGVIGGEKDHRTGIKKIHGSVTVSLEGMKSEDWGFDIHDSLVLEIRKAGPNEETVTVDQVRSRAGGAGVPTGYTVSWQAVGS